MKQRTPFVFVSWLGLLLLAACTPVQPRPTTVELLKTAMTDLSATAADAPKPDYVTVLERVYGAPSQAAFGSAVFYTPLPTAAALEGAALDQYRYFVGHLWEQYGETAWRDPWRQLYSRPSGATHDIVGELRALHDHTAALSAGLLLDEVEDATSAQVALIVAFDDPRVTALAVYNLGDGGAMNGLLVAGWRQTTQEAIFLFFLID